MRTAIKTSHPFTAHAMLSAFAKKSSMRRAPPPTATDDVAAASRTNDDQLTPPEKQLTATLASHSRRDR
ncbi:unnamed protein product [Acanthoscelides obtectus]|uniref:Uncharacterized protein n=1 Tax=Acanthoscelides obtectus TaxID=200917 RepID=A0A9P0M8V5_ACAOB|nr:unnamed protein product [Acanthoscelides obtectus]CAK1626957.1 hypothetical protein AOBTE_LOCUS4176 [Acanthoscelides obtectus]